MTQKAADDFEAIRRRLEELEAEQRLALTGSTTEQGDSGDETKSVESVYGYGGMCGFYGILKPTRDWPLTEQDQIS